MVAELKETVDDSGKRFRRVCFSCLPDTWRVTKSQETESTNVVSRGRLLAYLNPVKSDDREPLIQESNLEADIQSILEQNNWL